MGQLTRIILVLACMAVVVGVGLNGTAWADKLNVGEQRAGAGVAEQAALAKKRPKGSVPTTPECIKTLLAGKRTVGSVAEWILANVAHGKLYEACVVKPYQLPAALPGKPLTYPVQLIVHDDETMTVAHTVCFPIPPGRTGSAYYWDGLLNTWVKSTDDPADGKACVTIPAEVQAPAYAALCEAPKP